MFKTMMGSIDLRKKPTADEISKISSYIFCRWLSGNPHTIQAANMINMYDKIPVENQYHMIKSAFGGKIKYIPYPKNVTEDKLKSIEFIGLHFKISEEKAKEYMEFISKEELKFIVDMYTEFELR
jgi:hypothetical protein